MQKDDAHVVWKASDVNESQVLRTSPTSHSS